MLIDVKQLEVHAGTNKCNLKCEGCSHFSNYDISSDYNTDDVIEWIDNWSKRIKPVKFKVQGGEPLLNKRIKELLLFSKKSWPETQIVLNTNGLLLNKHDGLIDFLIENQIVLYISKHSDSDERYTKIMYLVIDKLKEIRKERGLKLYIKDSVEGWYNVYKIDDNKKVHPHNDDYMISWKNCFMSHCKQIYKGMLFKCPVSAYLQDLLEFKGQLNDDEWKQYIGYQPLAHNVSDEELASFLKKTDEPENICSVCPNNPQYYKKNIF